MTHLLCDFDGPLPDGLLAWITQCCRLWEWPLIAIRYDRTRRGWHVIVTVNRRLTAARTVAAQAIFGSDPRREMFNMMRVQQLHRLPPRWRCRWNVLYAQHSRGVQLRDSGFLPGTVR